MTTVSRRTFAAAVFTLAAVACSVAPDEGTSVEVQADQVSPTCLKGGITCGTPTVRGTLGRSLASSSGSMLATSDPPPPPATPTGKGDPPDDCGDAGCKWDPEHFGCRCSGVGYGAESSIHCPYSSPCPLYVLGSYRCYARQYCGL